MLLRLSQVAERLNTCVETVHKLRRLGLLKVISVGVSKAYRVEQDELDRYLNQRREAGDHRGKNAMYPDRAKPKPEKRVRGSDWF